MKRLLSLAPLAVAIAFPFLSVQACGPFFFDDVFVRPLRPDHPKLFVQGKLGALLPTYPREDLAVAYRYLNGGSLTAEEQKAYEPTQSFSETEGIGTTDDAELGGSSASDTNGYAEPPGLADTWLKFRNRYAPPQSEIHPVREFGQVYPAGFFLAGSYENCQADGFRNAIATLESRARTWGAKSPELADWIKGQDAVFSNCGSDQNLSWMKDRPVIQPLAPTPAPSGAPLLLRQDRAYQVAASQFYAAQFAPARVSFQAIAEDMSSPWHGIAAYLVARALVRDAFLSAPPNDSQPLAGFDSDQMKQAQQQLESIRSQHLMGISQRAIQELLNLVRLRTEPQARLRELSSAVAGPKTDPYYQQDLGDLTWYLNAKLDGIPIRENTDDFNFHIDRPKDDYSPLTVAQKQPGFNKAFSDVADLRTLAPIIDWLITFQSPADGARRHAMAEWRRTGSTPWLLAALAKASPSAADAPALIEAAGHIPSTSPAWFTATYHRERLLIGTTDIVIAGKKTEGIKAAGIETSAQMKVVEEGGSESATNLFRGLRMQAATTLDDALVYAPRRILQRASEEQSAIDECLNVMKNPKRKYNCAEPKIDVEFGEGSAALLNSEMPVAMLAQAAQSRSLPQPLRQSVAMMTWVRAVLLKNEAVAAQMLPLLPEELRQQAGPGVGFQPQLTILRNPGLRPYLDPGVQRSYSYDFVESFEDNWWCSNWRSEYSDGGKSMAPSPLAFLPTEARTAGTEETRRLFALGSADEYLGTQVIDYARAHPNDKRVPESLYLTLRMMRYGCYHGYGGEKPGTDNAAEIAHQVVELMRHHYPADPWTKKATPFVWLGEKKEN